MQSNNNFIGNGYRGNFVPMSPAPSNPGLNPRYVPPQRRDVFNIEEYPVRPQSSMSNISAASTSFESQIGGGVSINDLTNGLYAPSLPTIHEHSVAPGSYGRGMPTPSMNAYNTTPRTNGYTNGYTPSPLGYGGPGIIGTPRAPVAPRTQALNNGRYNLSGAQVPQPSFTHTQTSFLRPSAPQAPAPIAPSYGAIPNGYPMQPNGSSSSSGTAHDSVREGGDRVYDLVTMIRSGACDFPDDFDPALPGSGRAGNGNANRKVTFANNPKNPPPSAAPTLRPTTRAASNAGEQKFINQISMRPGNTKGNAAAFLNVESAQVPDWFDRINMGFKPSIEMLFYVLPAMEPCRAAVATNAGVVRIRNIPYATPRSEIIAFVGRNSQIVGQPAGSPFFGVHVIMERHTGKTMDAFIEFERAAEANWVVSQFSKRILQGRHPKMGDRTVEVELSSQEDLMFELFPRAKNVVWEGATPKILAADDSYYEGVKASGFNGYLQNEEMVAMVKHAEYPARSPFAQRCTLRVFESLISMLHKYPWFAHDTVNLCERRLIFDATMAVLRALIKTLREAGFVRTDNTKPTVSTLQELMIAILTCPGFSESQKAAVILVMQQGGYGGMTSGRGLNMKFGGNTTVAAHWPFQVLAIDPKAPEQLVKYFAGLLRDATMGGQTLTLADEHAARASASPTGGLFGEISIDYSGCSTLADAGMAELRTIESLLRRVLPTASRSVSNVS